MPLPTANLKGKSKGEQQAFVSKVISFLDDEEPDMKHDQKVAIALSHSRKMGANLPKKQENIMKTDTTELREFVDTKIEINEDEMSELKRDLREGVEEMTVSSNIEVGPPEHPVPAGQDFKKDKLPGKRDKSDHGVEDDEVEDIEDTDNSERTGYTGTQPANAKKKPVGEGVGGVVGGSMGGVLGLLQSMKTKDPITMVLNSLFYTWIGSAVGTGAETIYKYIRSAFYGNKKIQSLLDELYKEKNKSKPSQPKMKSLIDNIKSETDKLPGPKKVESIQKLNKIKKSLKLKEENGTYDDGKRDDIFQKDGGKIYPDKEEPPDAKETEVDDTDDTDDTERTGHSGMQAGNANVTPTETGEPTKEELIQTIDSMTDEEFDEFVSNLNEEEAEAVHELLSEYEEPNVMPDEIDASNPPDVGSEDEPTEEETEGKKHVAKQTDIMPEGVEPMDVVAHMMKKEK
jgi:hypothetical protein